MAVNLQSTVAAPASVSAPDRLRVLIAAGDQTLRATLSRYIMREWPAATITACNDSGPMLARKLHALHGYDLILTGCDFASNSRLWDDGGLRWLEQIRDGGLHPPIVIVADCGSEYTAVQTMAAGAADYLPQELLSRELLIGRIQRLLGDPNSGATELTRKARRTAAHMGVRPYGYELLDCLDYSGRRAVFLARSRELERQVVLKTLCAEEGALTLDPEYQRFAREFNLISYFNHPAVAGIFEFKANRHHCYIAMEYFPRGDLRQHMRRGLGAEAGLQLFGALLDALQLVHEAGIVHRDIKPSNVMLRDKDRVALIDFGLARQVSDFVNLTIAGEVHGTPYYMSPEQAEGNETDERSDLYSCGILLFELLTGEKPFRAANVPAILDQHVHAPVPELPAPWRPLQPVLAQLLEKAPKARYQDVASVRSDLRKALAELR